ncbi:phosphatidate cytidylyltransferase [Laribacter hongkongensis]|uniref:phosphatidate cytidylyltransferase n=1 Tax=Laribacter hongkongensis TaxID=168471 RepID=UPI001EFD0A71|nr:phosphatidate cytidylyltransferase [Laribacter hongkongensis]MCG9081685.1 phosphatidate cytidylyltransferase [Laribacter hongkongensis]
MLRTRILTALVLLPLMIGALFFLPEPGWAAFAWLITAVGLWEWGRFFRFSASQHVLLTGGASILAGWMWLTGWQPEAFVQVSVLVLWLAVAPLWLKFRWILQHKLAGAFLGLWLLLPLWLALLEWRPSPQAAWQLLALMALVWVADTAAYFSGKAFGRHKLAPAVSPGKSWEGVYGALIAVGGYALLVRASGIFPFSSAPVWVWLVGAWLLTAVSIVGDLLESWFKRMAGMKDSSQLLPGHGGVLDRIDSLIAMLAVASAVRYFAGA